MPCAEHASRDSSLVELRVDILLPDAPISAVALRIPLKSAIDSDRSRPPIPIDAGHCAGAKRRWFC
jgi:hypothetical protein